MSRLSRRTAATVLATAALAATSTVSLATAGAASAAPLGTHGACSAPARPGHAACFAEVVTRNGRPVAAPRGYTAPAGYGPADLRSAYRLNPAAGQGRTVAIVDAYDDPSAERDLAVYRARYGLRACTSANGCFTKVDQRGGHRWPHRDAGWAGEISLDLDMVSATCPACKIVLVEADSDNFADLAVAVDNAASRHPAAISNSYGGPDFAQMSAYNHPGIAITASTGDNGYKVAAPASFGSVVAVGGTTLRRTHNARGWTESAWHGAGSGCSTKNPKPSWQSSATRCTGKTTADVAAVADPGTGVAVYDSTPLNGFRGWGVYGGTSAAAPIIASVYAMAGPLPAYPAAYTWSHPRGLNDVTGGTNGRCSTQVWCGARGSWDGPTGLGTPNGTSAF